MRRLPANPVDFRKILWIVIILSAVGLFFRFKSTRIVSPIPSDEGIKIIILPPEAEVTPVFETKAIGGAEIP